MMDEQEESPSDEIDNFVVTLSYCESNRSKSYSGQNGIAVITLSYDLQCVSMGDCFEASVPPTCENDTVKNGSPECVYVHVNNLSA